MQNEGKENVVLGVILLGELIYAFSMIFLGWRYVLLQETLCFKIIITMPAFIDETNFGVPFAVC